MKYTISSEAMQAYATLHNIELPFDSLTFEWSDSQGMLQDVSATKTIPVELGDYDTSTLLALAKIAQDELEAAQLARDVKGASIPVDLTVPQIKSVVRKFKQNPDGSPNIDHFFRRVRNYGDYCGLQWCGMFLGIEKDGYAHS